MASTPSTTRPRCDVRNAIATSPIAASVTGTITVAVAYAPLRGDLVLRRPVPRNHGGRARRTDHPRKVLRESAAPRVYRQVGAETFGRIPARGVVASAMPPATAAAREGRGTGSTRTPLTLGPNARRGVASSGARRTSAIQPPEPHLRLLHPRVVAAGVPSRMPLGRSGGLGRRG